MKIDDFLKLIDFKKPQAVCIFVLQVIISYSSSKAVDQLVQDKIQNKTTII